MAAQSQRSSSRTSKGTRPPLLAPLSQTDVEKCLELLFTRIAAYDSKTTDGPAPITDHLDLRDIVKIVSMAASEFHKQPTLLEIEFPEKGNVIVCGDLHGSIRDLLEIFRNYSLPPAHRFLFLGDMVDRGEYSIDVVLLLFLLKIRWPSHLLIVRGNHECIEQNESYGFRDECMNQFGDERMFVLFNVAFDHMPIAAIINDTFFCCHGGVSQWITSRDSVRSIRRPVRWERLSLTENLIATDLLWADPVASQKEKFRPSTRGCGYMFNKAGLEMAGYQSQFDHKCLTVHSTALEKGNRSATVVLRRSGKTGIRVTPRYHAAKHLKQFEDVCNTLRRSLKRSMKVKTPDVKDKRLCDYLVEVVQANLAEQRLIGHTEVLDWVKKNVGATFTEYAIQQSAIRRDHAAMRAARVLPGILSIILGDGISVRSFSDIVDDLPTEDLSFLKQVGALIWFSCQPKFLAVCTICSINLGKEVFSTAEFTKSYRVELDSKATTITGQEIRADLMRFDCYSSSPTFQAYF